MWWRLSLLGGATVVLLAFAFVSLTWVSPAAPAFPGLRTGTVFLDFRWTMSWGRLLTAAAVLGVGISLALRTARRHARD